MTLEVQLRLTPSQAANADLVREAACRKARIAPRTLKPCGYFAARSTPVPVNRWSKLP